MEILITILLYAGIVQGFYMALLLNHTQKNNSANKYVALLLVIMSISIVHTTFVIPEIHKTFNNGLQIREPFLMLIIPLIWLYVKKLEQPLFQFSVQTSLHFLPFILFMSVNIPAFFYGSDSLPIMFRAAQSPFFNGLIWLVLLVQYSAYFFQILKLTRSYKLQAEQELSNIEHVDITWVNAFLYAFVLVLVLLVIIFIIAMHKIEIAYINQIISLTFSLTIFILGFKGLFQQSIFSNAVYCEIPLPV